MTESCGDERIARALQGHEAALKRLSLGRLSAARRLLRRSLTIFREESGDDHPDVANVLNALGVVLLRQGDAVGARRRHRRAWRILRPYVDSMSNADDATPPSSTDPIVRLAVQTLGHLGTVERETGNWRRAGGIFRRALRVARERLGRHDLDTANAWNNLGIWCKFTGRFDAGRRCYRRALAIFRRQLGTREARRSAEIAGIYHNLGGLEHAAGNFAAGEPFARRSVKIRRRSVGPAHFDYASDVGALAALVADQGRYDEAEGLYREALDVFRALLGSDHYEIAVLLHNLAAIEACRGRLDSAWELYHESAAMKQRWLGPDHPDLALTLHNLATLAYELQRHDVAAETCRRVLAILTPQVVETHPTLVACRQLAEILESLEISKLA